MNVRTHTYRIIPTPVPPKRGRCIGPPECSCTSCLTALIRTYAPHLLRQAA